jgi:hypothetical protein
LLPKYAPLGGLLKLHGAKGSNFFGELPGNLGETGAFGRGDPFQPKPPGIDSQDIQQLLGRFDRLFRFDITIQVMTIADVSPGHEHSVCAPLKGLEHEVRVDLSRAHDPDQLQVGRVLKTADPGQVRSGVSAPVACETNDLRIEAFVHGPIVLIDSGMLDYPWSAKASSTMLKTLVSSKW